jgi:uncharacterized membrane protein
MSIVRFFMLLSLVCWIGGIIFFAFVMAPSVFAVLPTRELAGRVVNRTLPILHWIGLASGVVFLLTSMANSLATTGSLHPFACRNVVVLLMIVLVLVSQFGIGSKMMALRRDMGPEIDIVPKDDPRRVEFNRLHHWSTRVEGAVLIMGLAALYLTARKLS